MKKTAFTLIELIISIVILSILMLFLYKSYATLNRSNTLLKTQKEKLINIENIKKCIYLDFAMAIRNGNSYIQILRQDKRKDVVFMQTKHSLHKRINPYIAYIFKDKVLYRLESLKPFKVYPLGTDSEFVGDRLGKIKIFRTYKSREKKSNLYLVHILFQDKREILLKTKVLSSY